ncbi:MAG TPA: alpha/beta fold hydrolase, partial [Alphaproteobacteria bacterium]|nr:alpha/beta fold hydrolase [Alphaproteobacteria bacterium]
NKQVVGEFSDQSIFDQILSKQITINTITGTEYINPVKENGRAVLILPGIFESRKQFDLLSKRIALQGYKVLSIDLPGQGDSGGEWRLGLMSEFIYECVSYLRKNTFKKTGLGNRTKVTVIGHSAGAVASMFAALGYSQDLESKIYGIFQDYSKAYDALATLLLKKDSAQGNFSDQDYNNAEFLEHMIASKYVELKQTILASLKNGRFSGAKIDSFILLSPPPKFQEVMPPNVALWLGKQNPKTLKTFIDACVNIPLKKDLLRSKNPIEYSGNKSGNIEFMFLRIPEAKEFMEYISAVKNPADYANLLLYFEKKSDFIKYWLDKFVRPIPKLYIVGRYDALLKGFTLKLLLTQGLTIGKKRQTEIEKVYALLGNSKNVILPNTSHFLNEKDYLSINLRNELITDTGAVKEILSFLNNN